MNKRELRLERKAMENILNNENMNSHEIQENIEKILEPSFFLRIAKEAKNLTTQHIQYCLDGIKTNDYFANQKYHLDFLCEVKLNTQQIDQCFSEIHDRIYEFDRILDSVSNLNDEQRKYCEDRENR